MTEPQPEVQVVKRNEDETLAAEPTNVQQKELTCKSNTKWKMANRATRCKRKLKSRASRNQESARETGQQTSEKKAEEWTYKLARARRVDWSISTHTSESRSAR